MIYPPNAALPAQACHATHYSSWIEAACYRRSHETVASPMLKAFSDLLSPDEPPHISLMRYAARTAKLSRFKSTALIGMHQRLHFPFAATPMK